MENLIALARYLLGHKKFILINCLIGLVAGVIYSFFIVKKQYSSTVTFLPPASAQTSMLSGAMGLSALVGTGSNALITSHHIPIIFESKVLKQKLVDKYGLIKAYKLEKEVNKYELAYKSLSKDLEISTTEQGSFGLSEILSFSLTFYHSSPDTALMGTNTYLQLIDSTIQSINYAQTKKNREYLETALAQHVLILDSLNEGFKHFQNKEKIYDLPAQLNIALQTYADIRSRLMFNNIKLQTLKTEMSLDNPEIVLLERENSILSQKMRGLETGNDSSAIVSMGQTTQAQGKFVAFKRDIETENQVIALLTQKLEEARIQEKTNLSTIHVVDSATKAAYKSRPKRIFLLAGIFMTYSTSIILFLVFYFIVTSILPQNRVVIAIMKKANG